jgi:hypothetical protein
MKAQSSTKTLLWFSFAMAIALIVYAIARNQLWIRGSSCVSTEKYYDLDGQAFLLDRKIRECKLNFGTGSAGNFDL